MSKRHRPTLSLTLSKRGVELSELGAKPAGTHRFDIGPVLMIVLILCLSGCNLAGFQPTPSPTPELPSVEFLFPANQSSVVEDTDLSIDLVARDASAGIAKVELLADGEKINEATPKDAVVVPVFRVNMNWLALGVGYHSISAVAYRPDGTASGEAIIIVEVVQRQ